jgi:hypothetical protein
MNTAFGGGLWPVMLFTVQGAPGAGKSSVGIQLAAHAALEHGSKVYIFAPDEGTRAACVRLGQYAGIERDLLELTRLEGMELLDRAYGHGKIHLVDADAPEAILETFLEQIAEEHEPGAPPPVFYADSIQTVRTDLDASFEGKRQQVAYVMATTLAFTRRLPGIGILVSHVNRPSFAAKKEEDRIDPLAAAAEAAEITRMSDVLLDLSGDIHAPEGIRAWLRKNRLHRGSKAKTRLRYEIAQGNFTEMDKDELEKFSGEQLDEKQKAKADAADRRRQKEQEDRVDRIERLVRRRPGKLTKNAIYKELGGRREHVFAIIDNLSDPSGVHSIQLDEDSGTYFPAGPKGLVPGEK